MLLYLVTAPFGSTVPLMVALVAVMLVAALLVAVGAVAAMAAQGHIKANATDATTHKCDFSFIAISLSCSLNSPNVRHYRRSMASLRHVQCHGSGI
jgi:hypothetical protein